MDAVVGAQSADVVIRTPIRSPCTKVMIRPLMYMRSRPETKRRKLKIYIFLYFLIEEPENHLHPELQRVSMAT